MNVAAGAQGGRVRESFTNLAILGTVCSVFLLGMVVLSTKWVFGYVGGNNAAAFAHGKLLWGPVEPYKKSLGWVWYDPLSKDTLGWIPSYAFVRGRMTSISLWQPLALVAIPTLALWVARYRRFRPGYCFQCGYNLTGNVSRICPECGTRF